MALAVEEYLEGLRMAVMATGTSMEAAFHLTRRSLSERIMLKAQVMQSCHCAKHHNFAQCQEGLYGAWR